MATLRCAPRVTRPTHSTRLARILREMPGHPGPLAQRVTRRAAGPSAGSGGGGGTTVRASRRSSWMRPSGGRGGGLHHLAPGSLLGGGASGARHDGRFVPPHTRAPRTTLRDGQIDWILHQFRRLHTQQVCQPHQRAQRQILPPRLDPPPVAHRHVPPLGHLLLGQPGLPAQLGHAPTHPSHHRTGLFHNHERPRLVDPSTGPYEFLFFLTDPSPCSPLPGMFRRPGPLPDPSRALG
jgi:hypothetical protein